MTNIPGYWMNETSGVLRPAVEAYLHGHAMTRGQIDAMRAYLRQWMAGDWKSPLLDVLRTSVEDIKTRDDLKRWFDRALDEMIDPL